MLHDVGNNRDCDVDVDHRNNTILRYYFTYLSMALGSLLFYLRVLQQTARWRVFLVCNMIIKRRGLQNADDCRMWMRGNDLLERQMVCQRCSISVEEQPYARLQNGVQCNEWAAAGNGLCWATCKAKKMA